MRPPSRVAALLVAVAIVVSVTSPAVAVVTTEGSHPAVGSHAATERGHLAVGSHAATERGHPAVGSHAATERGNSAVASHAMVASGDAHEGFDAEPSGGAHGYLIEGTVTDADGQPVEGAYVLAQARGEGLLQNATSGEEPIRQSLFELVEDHPYGLFWNVTEPDGSYKVHVPRPVDYEVIAVTADGVSRLRTVSVQLSAGEKDLTVDSDRILPVEAGDPSAAPGEVATVELSIPNRDDQAVEDLTVALSPPAGWTIEGVKTAGTWDAEAGRLTFERVDPGEAATATVQVRVPADAERGLYRIDLQATARAHFVEHPGGVQVRVAPPDEATPTLTPTATERRFTISDPATPDRGQSPWPFLLSAGVFAVGAAFAGYSVWRTGGLQ